MLEIRSSPTTDKHAPREFSFELHEACAAWPEMSPAELRDLSDDIFANGLREPITLTPDGKILDGRNRTLACRMAGVEPKTTTFDGDPWLYSLSKNAHRRHLKPDQIAMIAARLATRNEGGDGSNQYGRATGPSGPVAPALSVADAAKAADVTESMIKSAKVVLRDGAPEEIEQVESSKVKLRKTADKIRDRKRSCAITITRSREPTKKASTETRDPIDIIASEIINKVSDGKWRTLSKISGTMNFASGATRDALRRLGGRVEQQKAKNGIDFEYRIRPNQAEPDLESQLAAANVRIADLETSLTAANAEITELKALLDAATAPAAPLDPDKKKTTPASQWKSKGAKHKAAASAAVAAN
jgi:hypothetical protein